MNLYCLSKKIYILSTIASLILFFYAFIFYERWNPLTHNIMIEVIVYIYVAYMLYIQSEIIKNNTCNFSNNKNTKFLYFLIFFLPILFFILLYKNKSFGKKFNYKLYIILFFLYILIGFYISIYIVKDIECSKLENNLLKFGVFDSIKKKILLVIYIILYLCIMILLNYNRLYIYENKCVTNNFLSMSIILSLIISIINNGYSFYEVYVYLLTLIYSMKPIFSLLYL